MTTESFEELFGSVDGTCYGCDTFARLNDLALCEECAAKLDRDLIRQRDWDYAALAFSVPADQREALRREIIKGYGEELELMVPSADAPKQGTSRKRKRKRCHATRNEIEGGTQMAQPAPHTSPDQLAEHVQECLASFEAALHEHGPFPRQAFDRFFEAVVRYIEATQDEPLIHRMVADAVAGLNDVLCLETFKTPGEVLAQVDRLACILFSGFDPYFEGDEPPGL
jgi:hypothetical protein